MREGSVPRRRDLVTQVPSQQSAVGDCPSSNLILITQILSGKLFLQNFRDIDSSVRRPIVAPKDVPSPALVTGRGSEGGRPCPRAMPGNSWSEGPSRDCPRSRLRGGPAAREETRGGGDSALP